MALPPGTRFGHYEITAAIGAGGMGEVYRAKDTTLKRDVALKILPQAFSADADRVARFQREAEALAAVNHPNIAQVYGLERSEGSTAIVMELIEGPTLADRIAQGAIAYDDALGIANQIIAALEAAHGRSIVHRDLKPANIKVRVDGTVKVLDFGIATAPESPLATSGRRSPTLLTPALTEAGILLGTAAYMAPEQARGRPVDERADIWAFGCVLYEMLTGQPAFTGEDVTTTLARVLEREANLSALPAAVPPRVHHTIELCLEKDPSKRIADIRDVKLALQGTFVMGGVADAAAVKTASVRPLWRRALPATVALLIGGGVVGLAAWSLWPAPPPRPLMRLTTLVDRPNSGNALFLPSISRDGSRIGFRAGNANQIFVRVLDEFDARLIPGTESALLRPPCFSPDGTWIAYSTEAGQLRKMPLAGGAALTVAEDVAGADYCDWGEDGYIYLGATAGIMRAPEAGGAAELVAAFDAASGETSYELSRLLPGGTQLLFSVLGSGITDVSVAVLDLETREKKLLLKGAGPVTFAGTGPGAAQGHLVYGRNGALFAAPFDQRTLEVGAAIPVLEGVTAIGPLNAASVSDTGTLAYFAGGDRALGTRLRWIDRDGSETPLPEPAHPYASVALSPDGGRVAVDLFDLATFTGDLWLYELDGDRLTRLTFGGINSSPVWTPDGQRLIYWHSEAGQSNGELRSVPADNSAPPVTLATVDDGPIGPTTITPDGTAVIGVTARGTGPGADIDIWALRLEGTASTSGDAATAELSDVLASDYNELGAMLSPDGRFLAYASNESGREEVYVVPYPGPGGKTQVSTDGGRLPRWNPNGRELFYVNGTRLMAVDVETSPVFRRLTPKALFEAPALGVATSAFYAVAPDGARFLIPALGETDVDAPFELRIVVNWFEELRELAPWPER
jgi:serine/threonine-protein kinase